MDDYDDYPRTVTQLEARFATEEACRDYLFALRWPDGFQCPRCDAGPSWPVGPRRYECRGCGYQASVTAGTIFHRTRTPLPVWFRAIWWVVTQKNGASALGLQRVLGLGSYETAWTWLHKLRRAMVRPGRDRLAGRVEVDESLIGGLEEGVHGRQTFKKALVAIAAEEDGPGTGRIRMKRIRDASADSLHGFLKEAVTPGSVIHTDAWSGYSGLDTKGYRWEITPVGPDRKRAVLLFPRVHRVSALVKRWLVGTHHGGLSPEHLDYYLDEYTFRYNRRTSRSRGKLFFRLVQQAVAVQPAPYESLIKHVRGPKPKSLDHNI